MSSPTERSTGLAPAEVRAELAVVGAGPGGLAAAEAAAACGVQVVLVDQAARPGGQYHRQVDPGLRARRPGALHHGWRDAARRMAAVAASPHVRHLPGTQVWSARTEAGGIALETVGGHRGLVRARELVLATGAVERVLPFPGWELPGVLTAGAAQALLKSQGIRPGSRVVVAGVGALLLPVAAALVRAGTPVVAVCDASGPSIWRRGGAALLAPAKLREAVGHLGVLARAGVPYRPRTVVVAVAGNEQVDRVTLARVDDRGRPDGPTCDVEVDALCVSHGFAPAIELAIPFGCGLTREVTPAVEVDQLQRTSVDAVSAVGEVAGIAGAAAAVAAGTVAGLASARRSGAVVDAGALRRAVRVRDRELAFGAALRRATTPDDGWIDRLLPDTVICRCEEVPYDRVRTAIERGSTDPRSVKLTTRCGMGYCQGRMCAPAVGALLRRATGAVPPEPWALSHRPVATPVRLGSL